MAVTFHGLLVDDRAVRKSAADSRSFVGLAVRKAVATRWTKMAAPLLDRVASHDRAFQISVERAVSDAIHDHELRLDEVMGERGPKVPAVRQVAIVAAVRRALKPWPVAEWQRIFSAIAHETAQHAIKTAVHVRKAAWSVPENAYASAAQYAEAQAAALAKGLDAEQLATIRMVVADAVRGNLTVARTRQLILDVVGLNQQQARAMLNLDASMVEEGVDPDVISATVSDYAGRLMRDRADMIAHTEVMRALNKGTEAGWSEAQNSGLIPPSTMRVWIASPDACEFCRSMDGWEAPIDGVWETEDGDLETPQDAHPRCRCTEGLVYHDEDEPKAEPPEEDQDFEVTETAEEGYDDVGKRAIEKAGEWDEDKHPRGEGGRFTTTGGGTTPGEGKPDASSGSSGGSGSAGLSDRPSEPSSGQPRASSEAGGTSGASRSTSQPVSRAERARASFKVASKEKQDRGEANESHVARAIGGKALEDNDPMDVVVEAGGRTVGVEVKTFCDNGNDKVTMHPDSLARKEKWARSERAKVYTVVIDDRDHFGAGSFGHLFSGSKVWVRQGVGSFRLKSMQPVKSLAELRRIIRGGK